MAIERSIRAGIIRGICPFCLGAVQLSLVCIDCNRHCTSWRGEILPTSAWGQHRLEEEARAEAEEIAHKAIIDETVARFYV